MSLLDALYVPVNRQHLYWIRPIESVNGMMSTVPENSVGCNYQVLPEGIHEFILFDASDATLTTCFRHMEAALAQAPRDQTMLIISDIRGAVPQAHVLWRLSRSMFTKYPHRPVLCDAVLYHDSRTLRALRVVIEQISRLYGTRVRFYSYAEREKGVAWLLEQRAKKSTGEQVSPPSI
jgi:hypothetical protein